MAPTSTRPRPIVLGSASPEVARWSTTTTTTRNTHTVALWMRAHGHHRERQAIGGLVAAVGPAAGDERAGEQHQSRQGHEGPGPAEHGGGRHRAAPAPRSPSGSPALWCRITAFATSTADRR